ncbi:hypothetical protein FHS15_002939 [Paenibacillus castaneae]|nr:hypothetical protein [Paenibacillus castaneae]
MKNSPRILIAVMLILNSKAQTYPLRKSLGFICPIVQSDWNLVSIYGL